MAKLPMKVKTITIKQVDSQWLWKEIGKRFKAQREKHKRTQIETASALGVTRTTVTNIEIGNQRTTLETLVNAAYYFGCEPSEFFPW